jgi:hypothetical protein
MSNGRIRGINNNAAIISAPGTWSPNEVQVNRLESLWPTNSNLPANSVFYVDALDSISYPGSGTTWFDLSGNNNDFTIAVNQYNGSEQAMNFNSLDPATCSISVTKPATLVVVTKINSSTGIYRTLCNAGHPTVLIDPSNNLGAYNGAFFNSGYGITSEDTSQYNVFFFNFSSTSPLWEAFRNGSSSIGTTTESTISTLTHLGGNSSGSQYWGFIKAALWYDRILTSDERNETYNYFSNYIG